MPFSILKNTSQATTCFNIHLPSKNYQRPIDSEHGYSGMLFPVVPEY